MGPAVVGSAMTCVLCDAEFKALELREEIVVVGREIGDGLRVLVVGDESHFICRRQIRQRWSIRLFCTCSAGLSARSLSIRMTAESGTASEEKPAIFCSTPSENTRKSSFRRSPDQAGRGHP